MKPRQTWLTSTRLIFSCILVSLALSSGVGASGSSVAGSGNPIQDNELRKDGYNNYDNNTSYEKTPFADQAKLTNVPTTTTSKLTAEQELKANQAQLRDALQKQMTTLLQENAEINRQRIQVLEASKQRLLWAQIIVGILVVSILAALGYFWHLHAKNLVNRGVEAISNTLSNFQDSFLQFVDTTQMASNSSVSSFALNQNTSNDQISLQRDAKATPDLELTLDAPDRRRQALSAQRATNISRDYFVEELQQYELDQASQDMLAAQQAAHAAAAAATVAAQKKAEETPSTPQNKPDEFFAVKGYVDSWLRVYKPSEQSEDGIRLTPPDPTIELAKKEAEQENTLAFDRDANKMQARASYNKPLGYKKQAEPAKIASDAVAPQAKAAAAIENTQEDEKAVVTDAASKANKESEVEHISYPTSDTARLSSVAIEAKIDGNTEKHELEEEDEPVTYSPPPTMKKKPSSPRELLSQLDHCRANNDAVAYQRVYREIKKLFNLKLEPWEMLGTVEQKQLSDFPHVINKILELWASDDIVAYLERLLGNSRINPRQGFDLNIYEKLEDLLALARSSDRPRDLQQLKKLERAAFLFVPLPSKKTESYSSTKASAQGTALQIDASLSYQHGSKSKVDQAKLEAMITPSLGALDGIEAQTARTETKELAPSVPALPEASLAARKEDAERTGSGLEDKFMLSPFEVRIKLAVAYTEMGDHEGAILLLEEVIQDAPDNQRKHAARLIREIEAKKSELADQLISHAAQTTEPIAR